MFSNSQVEESGKNNGLKDNSQTLQFQNLNSDSKCNIACEPKQHSSSAFLVSNHDSIQNKYAASYLPNISSIHLADPLNKPVF